MTHTNYQQQSLTVATKYLVICLANHISFKLEYISFHIFHQTQIRI